MVGYEVQEHTFSMAGTSWHIRTLLDGAQFWDPEGEAAAVGISEEGWSHFGRIWPSGLVLAEVMGAAGGHGRVLEIGCGLALAGLVAHRGLIDITVSDLHPLGEAFLLHNLALNGLPPLRWRAVDWSTLHPALGRFDTIIGSDILYEVQQPAQLARFIEHHGAPGGAVIVVDPGRGQHGRFTRLMEGLGYDCVQVKPAPLRRERVMTFRQR